MGFAGKTVLLLALGIAPPTCSGIVLSASSVPTATAHLESAPWGTVKARELNWKLIPTSFPPSVQDQEVYVLRAPDTPEILIAPVVYATLYSPYVGNDCGIYLISQGGHQSFITFPSAFAPVLCEGVRSMGLVEDLGPRPRIALIYKAVGQKGHYTPLILSWSESDGVYKADEAETEWLLNLNIQRYTLTILRRLISQHFPAQPQGENHGKPIQ